MNHGQGSEARLFLHWRVQCCWVASPHITLSLSKSLFQAASLNPNRIKDLKIYTGIVLLNRKELITMDIIRPILKNLEKHLMKPSNYKKIKKSKQGHK